MELTSQASMPVIDVRNLTKDYRLGEIMVPALRGIDLQIFLVRWLPSWVLAVLASRP